MPRELSRKPPSGAPAEANHTRVCAAELAEAGVHTAQRAILGEVPAGKTPERVSRSGMLREAVHREGPHAAGHHGWLVTTPVAGHHILLMFCHKNPPR